MDKYDALKCFFPSHYKRCFLIDMQHRFILNIL